jgi:N-acetylmuramoyl-L-alanine amidase
VPLILAIVLVDRACGRPGPATNAAGVNTGAANQAPAYAAGACRAQAPTGRSRDRTVFVDAGHGGLDPGVVAPAAGGRPRTTEARVALAVATEVARQLGADGYRVVLSRTGDTSVRRFAGDEIDAGSLSPAQVRLDLQARVRCANDARAAALLSIHLNGYGDPSAGGSQTIYDDARPFSDQSARLARSVQSTLLARLGLEDRGILTDDLLDAPTLSDRADSYGHLLLLGPAQAGWLDRGSDMPGVLVEPLFLTAPAQAAIAGSASGQRKIGSALAAGLEDYLAHR